jgi:hypothetical protein
VGEATVRKLAPLSRIAIVAAALAGAAIAGALTLSHSPAVPAIAPSAPIAVSAGFDSTTPEFGDRVTTQIVIELDRRVVRPSTLRFTDGLAPLTQLGAPLTSRLIRGDLELVKVTVPVACLSGPCVARSGVTPIALPPVRASVSRLDGGTERASGVWPSLRVRGRVTAADLAPAAPPFEADASPPPPTYGVSPGALATVLDVLAALCAVGAVALCAWQAAILVRRRPARRGDALERALRLARESERLPVPERRRALGLLARLLGRDELSPAASELAWSERTPEPAELETLVSAIEQRRQP